MSRPARLTSEDWIRRSLITWAQSAPPREVARVEREARNGKAPPLPETYARRIAALTHALARAEHEAEIEGRRIRKATSDLRRAREEIERLKDRERKAQTEIERMRLGLPKRGRDDD